MSKKFLILPTVPEMQVFVDKANEYRGHKKGGKTSYTTVIAHPDPIDSRAACLTCPKCQVPALMTQAQIDSLITPSDDFTREWFPELGL